MEKNWHLELRIGNSILMNTNDPLPITRLYVDDDIEVWSEKGNEDPLFGYPSPVPITDKHLLRLGFYDDRGMHLRYELPDGFCILYLRGNLELFGTEEDSMRLPYQYIHQVQNLIHSLTGNMPSL